MQRAVEYLKRKAPQRDVLMRHPMLRPFAHRLEDPNLWRLNRRSVSRGVAVGLFFGVLIPIAHTLFAVLAAIPSRSNAIVAAVATWAVNPLTIPPLLIAAHRIGAWLIAPRETAQAVADAVPVGWVAATLHWLAATGIGLLPLALGFGLLGYALARVAWSVRVRRRWARRHDRRRIAA